MKRYTKTAIDFLYYIVGSFIYSFAITAFISANEISPGGFTGIATLVNFVAHIPTGVVLLLLNVPVIILGFVKLGGAFILKTSGATVILSVCLDISEKVFPRFDTDSILASLFGGILMGLGLSLILLRGATTGGVDIIAKLINRKFRHISVGRIILALDAAVILLAAFVYKNIESALYSVVAMYASSRVMDTLLYGADKGKLIHIVTEKPDVICHAINERLRRGVTKVSATGGYTGESRTMLICTVRHHEAAAVHDIIREFDQSAFIIVSDAGEIIGEGFKMMHNS